MGKVLTLDTVKKFVHQNKIVTAVSLFAMGILCLAMIFNADTDRTADISSIAVSNKTPYLQAYRLQKGDFTHSINDVYGKISASQSEIGFRLNGVIKELAVDNGDVVKSGDLLANLDDTELFLVLKEKEVLLRAAEIEQKKAEKIHADNRTKNESGYITSSKLEDYAFDVALKKSAFEAAEINLRMARLNYEKSKLKAPFDAVVIERKAQAGENVKAGDTAFILMDISNVYADIEISQEDSANVQKGQDVVLKSGEEVFPGKIAAVIPALLGRAMVLTARVAFNEKNNSQLPGTFVSGDIILNHRKDVFSVPLKYMFRDERGFYVWHYRDDCTLEKVYMQPGYTGDDAVIIEKGAYPEMIIVTSEDIALAENMQADINLKQ